MEQTTISVTLSEETVSELDELSEKLGSSQSRTVEFIIKSYLAEKRRIEQKDNLMRGYAAMADINISIVEECFDADQATQDAYEHYLMGCE